MGLTTLPLQHDHQVPPGPWRSTSLLRFRLTGGRVFVLSNLRRPGRPGPRRLEGTRND